MKKSVYKKRKYNVKTQEEFWNLLIKKLFWIIWKKPSDFFSIK